MRNPWFCGTGTALTLVLMGLPCSVGAAGKPGQWSYFSLTPPGQGNWFPMLAAVFTVLAMVFLLRKPLRPMVPVCLLLSAASQLLSWPLFGSLTVIGAAAVLLQLFMAAQSVKKEKYSS